MATVNGYTAEKMDEISNGNIVSAALVSDDLVFTTKGGDTINIGNIRGPQGVPGPGGSDLTTLMELLSPIGGVQAYAGSTPPSGWLICDGSSVDRTTYSDLFAAIDVAYGSVDSSHFNLPDLRQSFPMGKADSGTGSTLGGDGGSKDAIVPSHSHPHSHTISSDGAHRHGILGDTGNRYIVTAGGVQADYLPGAGPHAGICPSAMDSAGTHTHTIASNTTVTGVSATDANLPPYVVFNYIIRY